MSYLQGVYPKDQDLQHQMTMIQARLEITVAQRVIELDYFIDIRLQILREDTEVALRQLETLTPRINRLKVKRQPK